MAADIRCARCGRKLERPDALAAQFQRLVDAYDGEGWDTVQALLARFAALNEKAGT